LLTKSAWIVLINGVLYSTASISLKRENFGARAPRGFGAALEELRAEDLIVQIIIFDLR
jgi:hypothetical protein